MKFSDLESAARICEQKEPLATALRNAHIITAINPRTGWHSNSLTGRCLGMSDLVERELQARFGARVRRVFPKLHAFLGAETDDRGSVIVDPTLGQYIPYTGIFVGGREELRELCMDQSKLWLPGNRRYGENCLATITRAEFFESLY